MGICWDLRLKTSNKDDAGKLVAYAKELNKEFCLEPYNEKSMDGLEFFEDGFCFSEVKEEPINRFHKFLDQVVAHFPNMDMQYTQVGDGTHCYMFVNKNGKLEQYNPGTMYMYVENASDYIVMVSLAEKILKEQRFVMVKVDGEQQTISWEYEFDNESSKEKCDAVISSISKAMPSTRLVCYCVDNLVLERYIERYCYAFGGNFKWMKDPGVFSLLENEQLYSRPELVADPVGCYEKLLAFTRSGNDEYTYSLINTLTSDDKNLRAEFLSKLKTEDRTWILERTYGEFLADGIEEIVKIGLITAEEAAQRREKKAIKAE